MMGEAKGDKIQRVLHIYTKLLDGHVVNKAEEALACGVNERSIQRDIEDIREFLDADSERTGVMNSVVYDRMKKGYCLESVHKIQLKNSEVLAICKILLHSRAFVKDEMVEIIEKLINCCVPKANQKQVKELLANEEFHYVELRHKTKFMDCMWDIGRAIREKRFIEIDYCRLKDKSVVHRKVKPLAIIFSEFYFYLTALIQDNNIKADFDILKDSSPTIYRIDRIKSLSISDERFHIPYSSRFEEGEFRKRIQFMYGGKLQTVTFRYSGLDVDAVLDRLPTAKILDEDNGVYTIKVEVFGNGIDMWLRSQGGNVEVL